MIDSINDLAASLDKARSRFENRFSGSVIRWLFALAMACVIVWSYDVRELESFQQPELARVLFWHLPCPILASVLQILGAYWSLRVFMSKDLRWDVKASAANELGMIFSTLTLLSGMIFSKAQWGAWWQWDPRQTSYLLVALIYMAYFMLRGAFSDRLRSAVTSAGYALFAILPVFFLTYIFPRLPQIEASSFHPTQSIMSGQVRGSYAEVLTATILMTSILATWLFRLRVRAGLLELKTYELLGLETHRNGAAAAPVVRPVPVPSDHGGEA